MKIDLKLSSPLIKTARVAQVAAAFDCPLQDSTTETWSFDFPFEDGPWNIGLIVGPSGSGKSSVLRQAFGDEKKLNWSAPSVVDDFDDSNGVQDVVAACSAVGFNTIPSWLKPFAVLSNGEKFRVELARRLLESPKTIVVDEFTSVVDRQVAKIGSHAVQKFVRKNHRQFVAATCHYDVLDWLQPDWVLDMATQQFTRRLLQRRPSISGHIRKVDYKFWQRFSKFHYLSAELNRAAKCFCLFIDNEPVAFAGLLHRPHATAKNIVGVSRLVTLPDWQGLGLAFVLSDTLGSAHRALGLRLHMYPAHPSLIRSYDASKNWVLTQKPKAGGQNKPPGKTASIAWRNGARPCAVFRYNGPEMDKFAALKLLKNG